MRLKPAKLKRVNLKQAELKQATLKQNCRIFASILCIHEW